METYSVAPAVIVLPNVKLIGILNIFDHNWIRFGDMRKVQGNDSFQRINFLYQISKDMAAKNPVLSAYYSNLIINVAKKNVLKIHPDMKRQICKKCRCILIDGKSAKIKIKTSKKTKHIVWMCNTCGTKKSFPANEKKDHRLWVEKQEAVEEVIC